VKGRKPQLTPSGPLMPPPPPPKFLKGDARAEWKVVVGILSKLRVLSESDHAALVIYCTSYARYKQAERMLEEESCVVPGDKGIMKVNGWVSVQKQAFDRIRPLLSELGLTPCSRNKMNNAQVDTTVEADEWVKD
jgi:P27 family predicted phage terminase small subunit